MTYKWHTLIILFSLIIVIACKNRDTNNTNGNNHSVNSNLEVFIAQTIYTYPKTEGKFQQHLKNNLLPIWNELKDDKILSEMSVFNLKMIDSTDINRHFCNFLILAHLYPDVKPNEFLNAKKLMKYNKTNKNSIYQIQRTEILNCIPNAYFPAQSAESPDNIDYLIEFIAVKDSINYLKQFHDLMQNYFGPLNGVLVNEGKLYNIYMMETTDVVFQIDNSMTWNQIHLSGDFPEFVDINWDSLYTDLFRRTFSCELDSVWVLLPPRLKSTFDCTGILIKELYIR